MMVSTATHPLLERQETVGLASAGRMEMIFSTSDCFAFIFNPTFSSAAMAPLRRSAICSALLLFQASFQEFLLAMNWVVDSQMVSMIFNLLALRLLPVSVSS